MKKNKIKRGMKVTYVTPHRIETGIVKRICENEDSAFVVYNCGENWNEYQDYTAAKTKLENLKKGWDKCL